MNLVPLAELIKPAGTRAGTTTDLPVYSVTKHVGFVPSLEYFKKQVFSRNLEGYRLVEPGDFAYATIHLDEGSIGIAPERGLISPMYTVFKIDDSRVDPGYLVRFLKSPSALAHYPRLGKGAIHRRKAISLDALGTLPVPLPSLHEQRRITSILDQADVLRAKRRQVLALLDTLTQSTFREMFGTGQFVVAPLKSVMFGFRNGLSPSTTGPHPATVLTLAAVTGGRFNPLAAKKATFAAEPPKDKLVTAGDFLICRGNGNKSLVGVGTYSEEHRSDLVFPDTVIAGTVNQARVTMNYLNAAWKQPSVRHQIEAGARTTNGTHKINQQVLASIMLTLPPIDMQRSFDHQIKQVSLQQARARRSLAALDALFQSLQSRAFRGDL